MSEGKTIPQSRFAGEPALEDLIGDPIVRAVMRMDGLAEADLRRALSRAAANLRRGDRGASAA